MTNHDAPRERHRVPIKVRPGLAVSVTLVTVLLAAFTLPATVPDRPAFAYFSAGLLGVGVLIAVLVGADLLRARVARKEGIDVKSITLHALGSRLDVARPTGRTNPFDPTESANTADILFTSKDSSGVHTVVTPGRTSTGPVGRTGRTGKTSQTGRAWRTWTGQAWQTGERVGGGPGPLDDPAVAAKLGRAGLLVTGLAGALFVALGVLAPAGAYELLGEVALWVGTFALLITLVEALPTPRTSGGRILAAAVARRTGDPKRGELAAAKAGVVTGWALVALGVAASFLVGLIGLWGVLLGWMVVGSSRLAQAQQKTAAALDGLTVRDVMGPPLPTLTAWQTVSEALDDVVLLSHQLVFVVRDFDGSLAGVASLRALTDVPMDDRGIARVTKVMIPLNSVPTARPSDPLPVAVVRLARQPAAGVVLVLDDAPDGTRDVVGHDVVGHDVVGVIGPDEIARAVEMAPPRGRGVRTPWSMPTPPPRRAP